MGQACHIVNHESWGQNPQYIYTFIYFLWVLLVHLQQSHLRSNANAPRMLIKYQQPFRIIAGVVRICTITPQVWLVAHYIPSTQFFPPRQIHDEKTKKFLSLHHHHHQPRPQSSIRKWEKHKTYTELQLAQKFVGTVSDAKKCWERERERELQWHDIDKCMWCSMDTLSKWKGLGFQIPPYQVRYSNPRSLGTITKCIIHSSNSLFLNSQNRIFFLILKLPFFIMTLIYIYLVVWWSGWMIEAPGNHKRHQVRRDRLNQKFH